MQLEFGGQRISVAPGQLLVGSDLAAAVRLAGDDVLPQHAIVRATDDGSLIVEPAAGASVGVNGTAAISDPTPLLHGDRILVGGHEILVVDPIRSGPTRMISVQNRGSLPEPPVGGKGVTAIDPASRLVSLHDGREYQVASAPFSFGRDAGADVVVAASDASRHHAEIVSSPDGEVLVDLSSNGTYLNGTRINGRHVLRALDVIRIGVEEFRYYPLVSPRAPVPPPGAEFRLGDTLVGLSSLKPTPAPTVAAPPKPLAFLLTKRGATKGHRFAVLGPITNIGRADFNEIRVPDPSVSSSHAKLQLREGVWILTDLGSTNGSWVDDERIRDDAPLSPGAILRFGDVTFAFEPKDEMPRREERTALMAAPIMAAPGRAAEPKAGPDAAPPPAAASHLRRPASQPPTPQAGFYRFLLPVAIAVLVATLAAIVLLG